MGVGMCVIVDKKDADKAVSILRSNGESAYVMGEIVKSDLKIEIC
jgi:phosphoribosylformylglycinamidine cyclo-ligase